MFVVTPEMQELADAGGFYANQLLCGKAIWGAPYRLGLLLDDGSTRRVRDFAELAALGWCGDGWGPSAGALDALIFEAEVDAALAG